MSVILFTHNAMGKVDPPIGEYKVVDLLRRQISYLEGYPTSASRLTSLRRHTPLQKEDHTSEVSR